MTTRSVFCASLLMNLALAILILAPRSKSHPAQTEARNNFGPTSAGGNGGGTLIPHHPSGWSGWTPVGELEFPDDWVEFRPESDRMFRFELVFDCKGGEVRLRDGIAAKFGMSDSAAKAVNGALTRCFTELLDEEARDAVVENLEDGSGYRLASGWLAAWRGFEKLDELFEDQLEPHVAWALSNLVREHQYGFEQERTVTVLLRDGHFYLAEATYDGLGRVVADSEDTFDGEAARARYSRLIDFEATMKLLREEQEQRE